MTAIDRRFREDNHGNLRRIHGRFGAYEKSRTVDPDYTGKRFRVLEVQADRFLRDHGVEVDTDFQGGVYVDPTPSGIADCDDDFDVSDCHAEGNCWCGSCHTGGFFADDPTSDTSAGYYGLGDSDEYDDRVEIDEDGERVKSLWEEAMEDYERIPLSFKPCHCCGFEDCRCDGTATDWPGPRRSRKFID